MKVQANYNQFTSKQAKPTFGNYVVDKRISRAVGSLMSGKLKTYYKLGRNNGENLNNIVTAAGTAFVAPVFIRFNPLSNEDPKVKSYSALRQPLSAVLALSVQLPVMTAYNLALDKWAASGKIARIDLRAKPPESVVEPLAKSLYKQQAREYFAGGGNAKDFKENFRKGLSRKDYIEDLMSEARNNLFYAQRDNMRALAKEDKPITTRVYRDANGKVLDWARPTKLTELPDLEFVKPDELAKARNESYPKILKQFGLNPDDKKLFDIKYDWSDADPKGKHARMVSGEIEVTESMKSYDKDAIKSALKKSGKDYKEFLKVLEKTAEESAIRNVKSEIAQETNVKFAISEVLDDMKSKLTDASNRIYADKTIQDKTKAINEAEAEIIKTQVEKFEDKIAKSNGDDLITKTYNRAIDKIKDKKIADLRFHGATREEVETSVKVKKWLRAEINRREGVYKNFKKLSGLVFGLAILPFTCGLLNWAYPRFMEKFFPSLCDAKKQAVAAKEGK